MKTILIVEDEQDVLALVAEVIGGDSGYRIIQALDGPQALDLARRQRPDLVLLDVMLPGMDGFEVCRRLKADPETSGIKVVFVSARDADQDIEQGMAAGAEFYMTKPMRITDLSARIKDLIG